MEITITNNKYNFKNDQLFEIGKRAGNSKRNFLFISKLLGKHLPTDPDVCKATGQLLAASMFAHEFKKKNDSNYKIIENYTQELAEYIKNPSNSEIDIKKILNTSIFCDESILVIGFAETATGLGMSVASAINSCMYYTTTRETIDYYHAEQLFKFEETHSHATDHIIYDRYDLSMKIIRRVVLVDDELTTGNTMLNLIKQLKHMNCNLKQVDILTILDWRDVDSINKYKQLSKELDIQIKVTSLMSGYINNNDQEVYIDNYPIKHIDPCTDNYEHVLDILERMNGYDGLFTDTGRIGVTQKAIEDLEDLCDEIALNIHTDILFGNYNKILVVGDGENIYIPSRIASYLNNYGYDAKIKSTTRSPIFVDETIIKDKTSFVIKDRTMYIYNTKEMENDFDVVLYIPEINKHHRFVKNQITINL